MPDTLFGLPIVYGDGPSLGEISVREFTDEDAALYYLRTRADALRLVGTVRKVERAFINGVEAPRLAARLNELLAGGDQPRVTEAELLRHARAIQDAVESIDGEWGDGHSHELREAGERLVAEVRRYHAMLLAGARGHVPYECRWCAEAWRQRSGAQSIGEIQDGIAAEGCPYAALEAEEQAIRKERP